MYLFVIFVFSLSCVHGRVSRFDRLVPRHDGDITGVSTLIKASLSMDQCARKCHDNSSCNIFSHKVDGGVCELMSKARLINTDENDGNMVFGKNAVCPIPGGVNNGQIVYFTGLGQGASADIVCDDFYVPGITSAICDVSGTWQGLNTACQPVTMLVTIPAEDKIIINSCFALTATPATNTSFQIEYGDGQGQALLVVSARFNHYGFMDTIIRNSFLNGNYGVEEDDTPIWPFQLNREFTMTICCEETQYKVSVDDVEVFTFTYRSPLTNVKNIYITRLSLRSVRFLD